MTLGFSESSGAFAPVRPTSSSRVMAMVPPAKAPMRHRTYAPARTCRQCEKADPEGSALETLPASPRLAQRHGRQGLRRERRTSAGLSHSIVSVDDAGRAAWSGDFELI